MRITPSHIAIGRMFEQNLLFEVPKYQRYYAWEDEQVNDFIRDIDSILLGNTSEHFFGGIVCVSKVVEGSTRQQKELIDGQQRITTAILLIVNIIRKYEALTIQTDLSQNEREIVESRISKLYGKYINYKDEINRQPQTVHKLVLSFADKSYFENILNNSAITPTRDSHRKLQRANALLGNFIQQKLDSCTTNSQKIDILGDIENILQSYCTVIFMDCDSRASAYKLFQVLNDRGAGLNEGDLLKSKTLEALEGYNLEQDQAQKYWDEILEEDPSKVESFLRTYFASCRGKRAGRASLYDDFLNAFFPELSRGELPDTQDKAHNLLNVIKEIRNESQLYRKIINGNWPYEEMQPVTGWDRNRLHVLVKFLSYDITLPILLAATKLDHKKYAHLVHTLEKFMFRYKTICGNGHQVLSELYNAEAKKIRDNPTGYSSSHLLTELRKLLSEKANDEVFAVQLKQLKYLSNGGNKPLRYFFSTLCDYHKWYTEGSQGQPVADKEYIINYDNVTIEHIDSQNPEGQYNLPETDIHKLFNLTILSADDNGRRVNNKPFVEKKPVYQNSRYRINQILCGYNEWNAVNAENWQEYIVNFACRIFTI